LPKLEAKKSGTFSGHGVVQLRLHSAAAVN